MDPRLAQRPAPAPERVQGEDRQGPRRLARGSESDLTKRTQSAELPTLPSAPPFSINLPAEPDGELLLGERVGEYCIDSVLGRGGFGAVYRASHPVIGKVVAI